MYASTLATLSVACTVAVALQNKSWLVKQIWKSGDHTGDSKTEARLMSFRINFLTVYLLNMFGDWLQGPYLYALYRSYGYSVGAIGQLFVFGFLSSAIFGTLIGSMADKYGRRNLSYVFAVSYALSCATKLSPNFAILAFGRILGGIATSLLFSVFESWMISEHFSRGFSEAELSDTFAYTTFGNGLAAILSGIVANSAVDRYGLVTPFVIAIGFFGAALVLVVFTWNENFGAQKDPTSEHSGTFGSLVQGFTVIRNDFSMFATGMTQSFFEGSMYIFIFMWSVAVEAIVPKGTSVPYGIIFASFMVSTMMGSVFFGFLMGAGNKWRAESILQLSLVIAVVSFILIILFEKNEFILNLSFNLYEFCIGLYFPAMGTVRSQYIPESVRSSVMNIFRIPLNLIVVVILFESHSLSHSAVFTVCTGLILGCLALQWALGAKAGSGDRLMTAKGEYVVIKEQ
ncbi:UNVERIFIED_CONTAM: Molybdate-anion transporter [Siphonaria sp. JEL0065]|nr:Molybdate-anion transporter [Siphonaria sp. JEL0065]